MTVFSVADLWAGAGKTFFTGYGPTETTIVNTMAMHSLGQPVCIGRPTPNNTIYVLDENYQPLPIGLPGLLWAGGAGISRGYVGMPKETAERWKPDPFAANGYCIRCLCSLSTLTNLLLPGRGCSILVMLGTGYPTEICKLLVGNAIKSRSRYVLFLMYVLRDTTILI